MTTEPPVSGSPPIDFGLPITPEQRRAIFAAGKVRRLDLDGLRDLTPMGSISALTRLQAAQLIDRLNAGSENAYPPNVDLARRVAPRASTPLPRPPSGTRSNRCGSRSAGRPNDSRLGWPTDTTATVGR
jgi:hypothetical protein